MLKIMLDPGHGKNDNRGALIGNEGSNVYDFSVILKKELEKYNGVMVSLTRKSINDNPSLKLRGNMANGYDLFISNHTNASGVKARGAETWLSIRNKDTTLANNLNKAISKFFLNNRGVKRRTLPLLNLDWYQVLRESKAAYSMLVEYGFHDQIDDCKAFVYNMEEIATVVAEVIAQHYKLVKKVTSPVNSALAVEIINSKIFLEKEIENPTSLAELEKKFQRYKNAIAQKGIK